MTKPAPMPESIPMLLSLSSRRWKFGIGDDWPGEGLVDIAGEVVLQAAQDVFGGQLFSGPAAAVGAGSRTGREPGAGNHVPARSACRSPPPERRWRLVLPLDAEMRATPHNAAKATSEPIRSGCRRR